MLRFFRHGDGTLALFNGADEGETALTDRVLARADAKGRPPPSAPYAGFQRAQAGRTLVLADTGVPPRPGFDRDAHARSLSFQISPGRERPVVNRCRARGAVMSLAEGVYLGGGGVRKSQQVVIDGHVGSGGGTVKWALRREAKKPAEDGDSQTSRWRKPVSDQRGASRDRAR